MAENTRLGTLIRVSLKLRPSRENEVEPTLKLKAIATKQKTHGKRYVYRFDFTGLLANLHQSTVQLPALDAASTSFESCLSQKEPKLGYDSNEIGQMIKSTEQTRSCSHIKQSIFQVPNSRSRPHPASQGLAVKPIRVWQERWWRKGRDRIKGLDLEINEDIGGHLCGDSTNGTIEKSRMQTEKSLLTSPSTSPKKSRAQTMSGSLKMNSMHNKRDISRGEHSLRRRNVAGGLKRVSRGLESACPEGPSKKQEQSSIWPTSWESTNILWLSTGGRPWGEHSENHDTPMKQALLFESTSRPSVVQQEDHSWLDSEACQQTDGAGTAELNNWLKEAAAYMQWLGGLSLASQLVRWSELAALPQDH
ncbi:unnamed protein product [Protopolystoma xenopodis]|uniref:Uncharacterized protein n=1 Tax=Protopolystoma xenopodis TaxID=117903 RepID=A0A3S4ZB52_9PLAT|nr:unnamed protein product [Protopolystoma xenopodis]